MNSILCKPGETPEESTDFDFQIRLSQLERLRAQVAQDIEEAEMRGPSILEEVYIPERAYSRPVQQTATFKPPAKENPHEKASANKTARRVPQESIQPSRNSKIGPKISEKKQETEKISNPVKIEKEKPNWDAKRQSASNKKIEVKNREPRQKQSESIPRKKTSSPNNKLKKKAGNANKNTMKRRDHFESEGPKNFEDCFVVRNPNILGIVFRQFTDLVLLQWEEAADLLIDNILTEEVGFFNDLESFQSEPPEGLPGFLEDAILTEENMRKKYLS